MACEAKAFPLKLAPFKAMNIAPSGQSRVSVVTFPHSRKYLYNSEVSISNYNLIRGAKINEKSIANQ